MYSNYAYPINIGNDDEITINEIASIIKILLNSNSKIIWIPKMQYQKYNCKSLTNIYWIKNGK